MDNQQLAQAMAALAHPVRLQILQYLAQSGECQCKDLVAVIPLAQSTISQHLKKLKQAGLLIGRIEAPNICYCVDTAAFTQVCVALQQLSSQLQQVPVSCSSSDCC